MKVIIGVEQEPRVQFTLIVDGEMPDIIKLRYLSPGEQWSYCRAANIRELTSFTEIKPWVKYSGLKG